MTPTPKAPPTPGHTPDPRLAALRALDVENLRNRIAASRRSASYHDRQMVDVPTHVAEALLDALAAAERARDIWHGTWGECSSDRDRIRSERDALAARLAGAEKRLDQIAFGEIGAPSADDAFNALRDYARSYFKPAPSEAGGEGRGTDHGR